MLRVLALASLYPDSVRPGAALMVERQLCALAARDGVEVEVAAPVGLPPFPLSLRRRHRRERGLPRDEIRNGLKIHRPRFTILPHRLADSSKVMARALRPGLEALRRSFPFDLIHAEFFWPDGAVAMRLARSLGVPFTVKARGPDFELPVRRPVTAGLVLESGASAARLLAVSSATRDSMIAAGLPAERIFVHRTGIDVSRFHPRHRSAAKAALKVDGPLLLCVGNLLPRKRQALALEALALLPDATLILVGSGPEGRALASRARKLGVADRLRMTGSIPNALLPAFFAAADVTVHTARVEGLANAWVESLACGTPVVATEAGGVREVLDRPEAGRIVEARPEAIAGAIRELLRSPPDPERVAAGVAGRFSWERGGEALEAHLRSALSSA